MLETAINSIPLRPSVESVNEERDEFYSHVTFENTDSLMLDEVSKQTFCSSNFNP